MGERTTEYRTPRRAGEPAPPRPRTPPHGPCGEPHPHFAHDWQTNVAAGSLWFRCPGREFGHSWPPPRDEYDAAIQPGNLPSETVRPRPKTELRRVTVCEHDERLEVKSVRGIGFSWRCTCGERGKIHASRPAALWAKGQHEATHA